MKSRFLMFALASLMCVGQALARVNVNTATAEELQTLNGIGPVRAQLIIDYRRENGPFKSIDDLRKIPELRGAVAEGLKGRITYSGPTKIPAAERNGGKDNEASATPAKPKALPPPRPVAKPAEKAAQPAAPTPTSTAKPAGPASPAKPAMPGKSASESKPVAPPSADEKSPAVHAPARPAMPGKPAAPAAAPAKPAAAEAKPAAPAKPAGPAMPGAPAKPAGPAQPAAAY